MARSKINLVKQCDLIHHWLLCKHREKRLIGRSEGVVWHHIWVFHGQFACSSKILITIRLSPFIKIFRMLVSFANSWPFFKAISSARRVGQVPKLKERLAIWSTKWFHKITPAKAELFFTNPSKFSLTIHGRGRRGFPFY